MNYSYKLNTTAVTDDTGCVRTTYGIEAYENGAVLPTRVINDIFCDREAAEQFIKACNILSLDIDHLDDAVADILCV